MSAESLSLQMLILSWKNPINFHCRYRFRAQNNFSEKMWISIASDCDLILRIPNKHRALSPCDFSPTKENRCDCNSRFWCMTESMTHLSRRVGLTRVLASYLPWMSWSPHAFGGTSLLHFQTMRLSNWEGRKPEISVKKLLLCSYHCNGLGHPQNIKTQQMILSGKYKWELSHGGAWGPTQQFEHKTSWKLENRENLPKRKNWPKIRNHSLLPIFGRVPPTFRLLLVFLFCTWQRLVQSYHMVPACAKRSKSLATNKSGMGHAYVEFEGFLVDGLLWTNLLSQTWRK